MLFLSSKEQKRKGRVMNSRLSTKTLSVCVLLICLYPWGAGVRGDPWFVVGENGSLRPEEISGAASTDLPNHVLLVSDEDRRNLYDHDLSTNTVTLVPFTTSSATEINDLEGLTRAPDGRYFMTASLSQRSDCGGLTEARSRLGSFSLAPSAGSFVVQNYRFRGTSALRDAIINRLPLSIRDAARFNDNEGGGLNVEALAFIPADAAPPQLAQDALLFGLRGPLSGTPARAAGTQECVRQAGGGSAFYIYLLNPAEYLAGDPPQLCGPFTVNLNGQGFRDATLIRIPGSGPGTGPRLLIIAGDVGGGQHPHAYLFNIRDGFATPVEIPLPADSAGRAVEAVAALTVDGVESLAFYEDSIPSQYAVSRPAVSDVIRQALADEENSAVALRQSLLLFASRFRSIFGLTPPPSDRFRRLASSVGPFSFCSSTRTFLQLRQ